MSKTARRNIFYRPTDVNQEAPRLLTVHVVLDPGEGDGPLTAALAEAQQEGPGTLVTQQVLLALLADEAHDGAAEGGHKKEYSGTVAPIRPPLRESGRLTRRSRGTAGVA